MFNKDWLNYEIEQINFRSWHIILNSRNENWEIVNTYPIVYDTNEEIDEVVEVTKDNLVVEWIPWENEGDAPTAVTVNKPTTTAEKTGNKIPNPNYANITSMDDIIAFAQSKWFIFNP